MSRYVDEDLKRERLKVAYIIAENPDSALPDLAKAWGISVPGTWQYLNKHDAGVLDELGGRKNNGTLFSRLDALARLKTIQENDERDVMRKDTAVELGLSKVGLFLWLRRWAPDGIQAAIYDLEDEDEFENVPCLV